MSTPPPPSARWRVRLLRAASFKLDAGSMFGLIPRVVWSRSVPVDDRGRMSVQHNCLLLERATPGDGPRRVLIESGTGDKLDPKMIDVFALETNPATGRPRTVVDALAEISIAPESIDAAVVTHLHFDHAGGLTRLPRQGETPQFPFTRETDGGGGSSQTGGCCLTFPNAAVYVQAREWADARASRSVMTRTYYPDHLSPLESRIRLIDSPRPFPIGLTPGRDDLPPVPQALRETELWPGAGIFVFLVPGHTWGQQAIRVETDDGRSIVFTPDVMPTAAHVGSAYSLAYDVEPYTSMLSRHWFLAESAARNWTLCLDHEPGHPLFQVADDGKGWYRLMASQS